MAGIELPVLESSKAFDPAQAEELYSKFWDYLQAANVVDPKQERKDLITWRRGSAQLAMKINPALNNASIYSVLVASVTPSEALFRHLLAYNVLQRRESLGLIEKDGKTFIVLKYTLELELVTQGALQRHVYALQEIADALDTELVKKFGGTLHFDDWAKLDQKGVDDMMLNLFGS